MFISHLIASNLLIKMPNSTINDLILLMVINFPIVCELPWMSRQIAISKQRGGTATKAGLNLTCKNMVVQGDPCSQTNIFSFRGGFQYTILRYISPLYNFKYSQNLIMLERLNISNVITQNSWLTGAWAHQVYIMSFTYKIDSTKFVAVTHVLHIYKLHSQFSNTFDIFRHPASRK